jgi:hypothetical protein
MPENPRLHDQVHYRFRVTTTFTIVDGHGLTPESENLKAIIKNEMDWISQDGNQMTGLIGPVAMVPYCHLEDGRGIKALMTCRGWRI